MGSRSATDPNRVPRPSNQFILFRRDEEMRERAKEKFPGLTDQNKLLPLHWRSISESEKAHWKQKQEEVKREHQAKHPGWKYSPQTDPDKRKSRGKKAAVSDSQVSCNALNARTFLNRSSR